MIEKICEKFSPYLCEVNTIHKSVESLSVTTNSYVLLSFTTLVLISIYLIKSKKQIIKKYCIWMTGPIPTVLFSMLNITWATQASLQAETLLTYIDFTYWKNEDQISNIGVIFLFAITTVILLTLIRDKGNKYLQERERTLPSSEVIEKNSNEIKNGIINIYNITNVYLGVMQPGSKEDNIKSTLKLTEIYILEAFKSITNVTNKWTESFCGDSKFNINFFSLLDINNVRERINNDETLKKSIEESPFFMFNDNLESRLEHCEYILVCNKNFSTSNKDGFKDGNKISLVMPYSTPTFQREKKAHPNFLGAPKALEQQNIKYIPSTDNISKELNEILRKNKINKYATPDFKRTIIEYYKYDTTKSILSIPVYDKDDKDKPLGVINIYSDINDSLQNKRHEILYRLIIPHIYNTQVLIPIFYSLISELNKRNENNIGEKETDKTETVTFKQKEPLTTTISGTKQENSIISAIRKSEIPNNKGT